MEPTPTGDVEEAAPARHPHGRSFHDCASQSRPVMHFSFNTNCQIKSASGARAVQPSSQGGGDGGQPIPGRPLNPHAIGVRAGRGEKRRCRLETCGFGVTLAQDRWAPE